MAYRAPPLLTTSFVFPAPLMQVTPFLVMSLFLPLTSLSVISPFLPPPLVLCSTPGIEPSDRRCLVPKALNIQSVLSRDQFDVLVGHVEIRGIAYQGDLVHRSH